MDVRKEIFKDNLSQPLQTSSNTFFRQPLFWLCQKQKRNLFPPTTLKNLILYWSIDLEQGAGEDCGVR